MNGYYRSSCVKHLFCQTASCCEDAFLKQEQRNWSDLMGKMDEAKKNKAILEENVLEAAIDLRTGKKFTFHHDNSPKHAARTEWAGLDQSCSCVRMTQSKFRPKSTCQSPTGLEN
ncbi:hypothetical protein GOODEAATRI_018215 [Goodea atripinnis]|uniref:Uncharacterized protein n=1 Tax=Goodea atripinnis TaxID=208336 RepID=A0ABV0P5V9_9TELE